MWNIKHWFIIQLPWLKLLLNYLATVSTVFPTVKLFFFFFWNDQLFFNIWNSIKNIYLLNLYVVLYPDDESVCVCNLNNFNYRWLCAHKLSEVINRVLLEPVQESSGSIGHFGNKFRIMSHRKIKVERVCYFAIWKK